ncbi:MAG: hypothetical protein GXO66_09475 [Euryarchaeota archaeon]|nr:hypothetical protein [Euryarchaeota archaeon]
MHRPVVRKPDGKRRGRGFSLAELREAGLTPVQARKLGIAVDRRRKSLHPENVDTLRKIAAEQPAAEKAERKEKVVKLEEIKGVGPKKARQLSEAGVKTANDLLRADLREVSEKSGISLRVLEKLRGEAERLVRE